MGASDDTARSHNALNDLPHDSVECVGASGSGDQVKLDEWRKAMKKKITVLLLCAMLLAFRSVATAEEPKKIWTIGLFHVGLDHIPPSLPTLRQSLQKLGYEEGKNIQLDWRNLPDEAAANATAKEFVRAKVNLIVAFENQTVRATKAATSQIPVVFLHVTDPVAEGFVRSLSHPGGNMTGFVSFASSPGKQVELFTEIVPKLHRLVSLIDPQDPVTGQLMFEVREAATTLKLQLVERAVPDQNAIERFFASVRRGGAQGIFPVSRNLLGKFPALLTQLSLEKRLPLAMHRKEWVERGALFSYGPDLAAIGRAAAPYIDKILKGTKPDELPVQQASQFELAINLKTAKQIGLTIPPNVLARADKLIK